MEALATKILPVVTGNADAASTANAARTVEPEVEAAWAEALLRAPEKALTITEGAAMFARQKLDKRGTPHAAVRLGIKGGGCSGFSYVIQFDDGAPKARDYAYEVNGVRFVIDKKSLIYLSGSTFDFEKTLMFQGFKFKNPNEASSCGCGHSFTVK